MKILLSWLREFVDVPGTAEEIARTMSVRGFSVEGIERLSGDDAVIDFEITANRPDCMCVIGMAREVATAYELEMRQPGRSSPFPLIDLQPSEHGDADVTIEAPDLCPRYAGAVADVKVGPSPSWMQSRLMAAGVRPISNIVDITNYTLLELGQPMHAFDLARLEGGRIVVRRARAGEPIKTLDGQSRTLTDDMLVIADGSRPVAIAGVMGGADSEVGAGTSAILFESACFNPLSVRRTSRKLGLKTEASMRFERGVDPQLAVLAMRRACALLHGMGGGKARGSVVDRNPVKAVPTALSLRRRRLASILGVAISDTDVVLILRSLGFELRETAAGWDVTVPPRRVDVVREIDLIEEVARHWGFDRIPVTYPAINEPSAAIDPRIARARQLRAIMNGSGFYEAVTFGFISAQSAAEFAAADDLAPIANPLSETFAVLRPTALPGLLDAVAHNRRREQRDIQLFEVGASFTRSAGERRQLSCIWTGAAEPEHWGNSRRAVDFFDIKGVAERISQAFGLTMTAAPAQVSWLVRGRAAAVVIEGSHVGFAGQLARTIAEQHGIPAADDVYVAEIDLDAIERLTSNRDTQVQPLPRFPSVVRDISILVADTISSAALRDTIREAASAALVDTIEFDRYQGKGVPDGKVSLSYHLTFRSSERTLTDAEVQHEMDAVLAALVSRHDGVQR